VERFSSPSRWFGWDMWSLWPLVPWVHQEEVMYKPTVITAGVIIALNAIGAGAAAAKLTDPQIAHIVYTADNLDIDNAKQALDKSKNEEVRRFANRMIGDHSSVNDQPSHWPRSSTSLLRTTRRARA
jgi:hypothetical protein